ncbi:ABC transporter permease [Chryseomicrobium sp. FSL W7-1435]|uniref:ABC transporter permease n=1 Tax=Chryseomicrobium sp. FSL W7-1435 TaxID=2921704 RepID=UPI00315AAFB1
MFLAWNEIKKNKLRFALVIGVLFLVSYLVFFLTGLANGLANLNREAVDKWDGDGIMLTEDSDQSLPQSFLSIEDADELDAETAVLGQLNTIVTTGELKQGVAIFGINEEEFITPDVSDGELFSGENEVVAADFLQEEGFEIGDTLTLSSSDEELTIVGFTEDARFNAAPVLYTSLDTFQTVRFGEAAQQNADQVNGIVIRSDDLAALDAPEDFAIVDTQTFIENLPGYTEQKLTLDFMIYFLFIISATIVAIFLYVLTVQKINMFGVMKAQGISNGYLARSVVAQTFILAVVGVVTGYVLTLVTGLFLPNAVPVQFDGVAMAIYGIVLIAVAILGAIFSVLTIVKIDPLKAIGA